MYIHVYIYIHIYTDIYIYIYIHHKRYSYWSSVSPTNRDFLATDPTGAPGRGRHQRGVIASKGDVPRAAEPRDPGASWAMLGVKKLWGLQMGFGDVVGCWVYFLMLGCFGDVLGMTLFYMFTFWRFSLTFSLNNSKLEALLRKTASRRIRAKGQDFKTLFFYWMRNTRVNKLGVTCSEQLWADRLLMMRNQALGWTILERTHSHQYGSLIRLIFPLLRFNLCVLCVLFFIAMMQYVKER